MEENELSELKDRLEKWIKEYWGERCPDYCESCPCCKAWDAFDYLFQHGQE